LWEIDISLDWGAKQELNPHLGKQRNGSIKGDNLRFSSLAGNNALYQLSYSLQVVLANLQI
jgi:hypothetical protein